MVAVLLLSACKQDKPVVCDFKLVDGYYYEVGDTVKVINTTQNAMSYYWSFGDSTWNIEFEPTHVYQVPGKYWISCVASNDSYNDYQIDTVFISEPDI